ncbi:hypothetical protein F4820DRAFT_374006 [Hypoxylon rubiginosum]|uniref:Uncharacterized protein n=1 Tax=Hypoxylon rubiginosum TaxID=110542 RepID=A0ACB9YVR4_9PEZI|nr:hypothetical protein F4820DRAFT_374006 [Hypoxylon rubiginosum]
MLNLLQLLLAACLLVIAQDNRPPDPNNHFIYPPLPGPQFSNDPTVFESNLNFIIGKKQNQPFKWESNMTNMSILLIQEGNPESIQQHELTECIPGSDNYFYWDGNIGSIDLKNGSQAFLGAYNCSNPTTPIFFSHYINLIEAPPISKPSSISTARTSSFSFSFSTSMATTATSPSIVTPTSTASPSNGPSNAAAIGGGIGGGLGGALLLIAIVFAFWKYRSKQGRDRQQQPGWANNQDYNTMAQNYSPNLYKSPPPTEIDSQPQAEYLSNIRCGTNPERRLYEVE